MASPISPASGPGNFSALPSYPSDTVKRQSRPGVYFIPIGEKVAFDTIEYQVELPESFSSRQQGNDVFMGSLANKPF